MMAEWTAQHGTITCNVAISACGMNGQRKRALGLLAEMADKLCSGIHRGSCDGDVLDTGSSTGLVPSKDGAAVTELLFDAVIVGALGVTAIESPISAALSPRSCLSLQLWCCGDDLVLQRWVATLALQRWGFGAASIVYHWWRIGTRISMQHWSCSDAAIELLARAEMMRAADQCSDGDHCCAAVM